MSAPTMQHNGGVYRLRFDEEMVSVKVDRIKETGDSVTAEIQITTDAPGSDSFLHQTRLNLLSTQARKTIAKHMQTRMELPDWDGMMEYVCAMVIRQYRSGQPMVRIGNMPKRESTNRYRLAPILVEGEANLIYAPGGSGKSYLAYFLSLLVQSGEERCFLKPQKGPVLFLDYETSPHEADERVKALKSGLNIQRDNEIHYRRCFQALASDIETIQRMTMDCKAELIVVDSVGSACGGEPESAAVVLAYFMALRSLGITSLSVDHVVKSADKKTPFGSVYKMNCARSCWELRKTQEMGEDRMTVGLFHRKVNQGRLLKPMGLEFTFFNEGNPGVIIHPASVSDDPSLSKELPLKDQIASVLGHGGGMTAKAIAEELSTEDHQVSEGTVRETMRRSGHIFVKLPENKWGLLTQND